jgi:hypothetical protein
MKDVYLVQPFLYETLPYMNNGKKFRVLDASLVFISLFPLKENLFVWRHFS